MTTQTKKVVLTEPVQRGDIAITEVTLRSPRAGDMRGMKLTDVLHMEQMTMVRLISRISDPGIAPDELSNVSGSDFVKLCTAVVGFFFTEEQMAEEEKRLQ